MTEQRIKKLIFYFKLYDLLYVLLAFNAFVNGSVGMKFATLILVLFGAVTTVCMAAQFHVYRKMPNIRIIVLFLISYLISAGMTWKYGITDNIKEMIWLGISMIVIYGSSYLYERSEIRKEFLFLAKVWVIYCTIANLVSISMVVWGRGYQIGSGPSAKVVGLKWGRLWGIYDDPNHGGTIAVAAIILAFYLIAEAEKTWQKRVCALTIAVQFIYLVLSDSRTGIVSLTTGVFCWVLFCQIRKQREKEKALQIKKLVIPLLAAVLTAAFALGASEAGGVLFEKMDVRLVKALPEKAITPEYEKNTRKTELESDASNGRLDIWKSGLEITKTSPVFGVSFRNMTTYAEANLPDTYLVNNSIHAKYDSMHNAVLDILVSQGIVGIFLVLLIAVNTLLIFIKRIAVVSKEDWTLLTGCFSVVAAMGAGSMFISMVFYLNGPQTYIFWLCFGYLMTLLVSRKIEFQSKKMLLGFIMDGTSGGVDNYILHFLEAVKEEGMQIDLLTNEADPVLEKRLQKEYGSHLYEIANLHHPYRQFRQIQKLIEQQQYGMVYLNISTSMDCVTALAAWSMDVPRRMLHSHSGGNDCESAKKRWVFDTLQKICRIFLYRTGTEFYACSEKAGYWMYPKKIVESDRFHVICNAVDQKRFSYYPEVRSEVRKELELEDAFVIGHAGNFCYQKNHGFLIRVFEKIHQKEPDTILLLIGKGIRLEEVKQQVKEAGLEHAVRFLGWRKDVDRLFQAMDVFVLPSHFEGLPTVGVEAQCTGLPCVLSDAITEETKITESCQFLSSKASPAEWAEEILKLQRNERRNASFLKEAENYTLEAQKQMLLQLVQEK